MASCVRDLLATPGGSESFHQGWDAPLKGSGSQAALHSAELR